MRFGDRVLDRIGNLPHALNHFIMLMTLIAGMAAGKYGRLGLIRTNKLE